MKIAGYLTAGWYSYSDWSTWKPSSLRLWEAAAAESSFLYLVNDSLSIATEYNPRPPLTPETLKLVTFSGAIWSSNPINRPAAIVGLLYCESAKTTLYSPPSRFAFCKLNPARRIYSKDALYKFSSDWAVTFFTIEELLTLGLGCFFIFLGFLSPKVRE